MSSPPATQPTLVSALRVANEALLVASTIERCPKTMMLREPVMNALKAAAKAHGMVSQVIQGQRKDVYRREASADTTPCAERGSMVARRRLDDIAARRQARAA